MKPPNFVVTETTPYFKGNIRDNVVKSSQIILIHVVTSINCTQYSHVLIFQV